LHEVAERRYLAAADAWRRAGDGAAAGRCERHATAERAQIPPAVPVNVNGLCD
jgi:hypothetical protein